MIKHDLSQTRRYLQAVMPAGTTLEMRIFKSQFGQGNHIIKGDRFSGTTAGWYDNENAFVADACRILGVSGYVTFNPCNPALLARSDKKLIRAKNTTTDVDILCLRWLYVDIDPVRLADISSTDEELARAIERRERIFREIPEFQPCSIWGASGNGAWILVRLPDYPNDDEHASLISRSLAYLAARFNDKTVKIDVKTKNASRVMCLPGTAKCKGSPRPELPWRSVTIDSPERECTTFDLRGWIDAVAPVTARPAPQGRQAARQASRANGQIEKYIETAFAAEVARVESAPQGGRNDALNRAAVAIGELVATGELSRANAEARLFDAARSIGLDEQEIRGTVASGLGYGMLSPRDLSHVGANGDGKPAMNGKPYVPGDPDERDGKPVCNGDGLCIPGTEENPHRLANLYLRQYCTHDDGPTLRFWKDEFYRWYKGHYLFASDKSIRTDINVFCEQEYEKIYDEALMSFVPGPKKAPPIRIRLRPFYWTNLHRDSVRSRRFRRSGSDNGGPLGNFGGCLTSPRSQRSPPCPTP